MGWSRSWLDRQVKRQIAYVAQSTATDHRFEHFQLIFAAITRSACLLQFRKCEVIHAVDVACAKCERSDTHGKRLGGYCNNVRQGAFAIADQIERFGACVLGPVTAVAGRVKGRQSWAFERVPGLAVVGARG